MRNITANAIMNLKENPPTLYVHGSIMVYREDDKVSITKAEPQGINPFILILDLKVINGTGPMKGIPRAFHYINSEEIAKTFKQVTIRYDDNSLLNIDVEIHG